MRKLTHQADLCIVGGGMTGLCAAVSAARRGITVALMQDRPVLGGNASSEIRMWICGAGAHAKNMRETGIVEELHLESLYRNPQTSYSIWDSVLHGIVKKEKNIKLFLNCSCMSLQMDQEKITSVTGWQMTTETEHTIEAKYFADCSGDGILAPLSGALYRIGREASSEFNETIEPPVADKKTMGMSCLFQIRETDRPQPFIPPDWAYTYPTHDDFPHREHNTKTNFWWIELGGDKDSIHDAEEMRDELLKIVFGIWDHMKNHGDHGVENWVIDWMGFLPGKRESRRLIGDHIITQNDVEASGKFNDIVAYGGWSMDDHFPAGFYYKDGYPTIFHPAPSPYGIPYRSLYSKNIENLFFAGRNISATHAALSSTRVMGTCSLLGQAIGTAAAIATQKNLSPRGVYEQEIKTLQQNLMEDDCFLPWHKRTVSPLTLTASLAASNGDAEALRNGIDRPVEENDNGWVGRDGDWVEYRFDTLQTIKAARFTFDSHLNRTIHNMPCNYPLVQNEFHVPKTLIKAFRLEAKTENGQWETVFETNNNYQRFIKIPLDLTTNALRFIPLSTWGAHEFHVFSWDIL